MEVIYYLVYAVELFLIGDGIFHNRVRENKVCSYGRSVYIGRCTHSPVFQS